MFNTPYDVNNFHKYGEDATFLETGETNPEAITINFLSEIAKETNTLIIGGTIPELSDGKAYNTSFVFDGNGEFITKYRKMHLFDINVPGQYFKVKNGK